MSVRVITGDCRDVLVTLEPDSFDSCVTDPPYHLTSIVKRFGSETAAPAKSNGATGVYGRASAGFMGQKWDGGDVAFRPETWAAVLRALKPGAHLIAFSGTRTYHRMVCAIENAGFEVRDQLAWVYGSGFPKSHNLDGDWQGWGTALKPAWEPIVLARKPLIGTVAQNVMAHGTGALNIDETRISGEPWPAHRATGLASEKFFTKGEAREIDKAPHDAGRWPANLCHDGSEEVLAGFPAEAGGGRATRGASSRIYGGGKGFTAATGEAIGFGDSGTAARFFYCAKATKAERGEGNTHPTVKPLALMRWLCRLITPEGGHVLDPFAGSGSTGIAADREGFSAILIEQSADYAEIARRRIAADSPLFAGASE